MHVGPGIFMIFGHIQEGDSHLEFLQGSHRPKEIDALSPRLETESTPN